MVICEVCGQQYDNENIPVICCKMERLSPRKPEAPTARKLALNAENAIFEALALSGEPISKDTETWLNAAAMLIRRAIESI